MSDRPKRFRQGTLVIIGGHEDQEGERVILREVVRRIPKSKLIVATIASEVPQEYFDAYRRTFTDLGVAEIGELYVRDRTEALDDGKAQALDGAGAILFTGGDQLRISSQIGDTPIYKAVHEIFARGGLVAGTSAGASVMSETMLVSGSSDESHRIGDLHMAPGLGLIGGVIIDSHFAEHGRIGRLLGAIAHNPRLLGIGIDEDTAIIVEGPQFEVIGSGAVYVIDGAGVTRSNISEAKPDWVLSVHDVRLHVLSTGDAFNLAERCPVGMHNEQHRFKAS